MEAESKVIVIRQKANCRAGTNRSAAKHPGEDPFFGHDAVSGLMVYGTAAVAFLANLGDFNQRLTNGNPAADRQGDQIDTLSGDVLGKRPGIDIQSQSAHFVDTLFSEQADLPVPVSGMGIAYDTEILP